MPPLKIRILPDTPLRSGDAFLYTQGPVVLIEWSDTPGWPIQLLSPNFANLLPLDDEQLNSVVYFTDLLCPDDQPQLDRENQVFIEQKCSEWSRLYRVLDGQGGYRWVHDHTTAVYDDHGEVLCLRSYLMDHTALTENQRQDLAGSGEDARWRVVLDATSQGVWDWNVPAGRVYFSPLWKSMLGYDEHEVGDGLEEWDSRLHPDDRDRVYADLNNHLDERTSSYENIHRIRAKNGSWRWILDKGRVYSRDEHGKPLRVVGTHTDITDQYMTSSRLKLLAANVPGALYQYRLRPDGTSAFTYASEGIEAIYEVTPEQVRSDANAVFDRLHPEDFESVARSIRISADTLSDWHEEYRVVLPKRGTRWLRGQATPRPEEGGVVLWHGYLQDITDEKRQRDSLREMEAQYRLAMEATGIGMWGWNLQTNVVEWSDEAYLQLGYPPRAFNVTLDVFRSLVHPDDWDATIQGVEAQMARNERFEAQFRLRTASGQWIWIEGRGKATAYDSEGGPTFMMGTHTNIDHVKKAEEALQTARRAAEEANEAKSRFLANMSHEIRTPMSGIIGLSDLGRDETDPQRLQQQLHKVHASAGQLLGILNDILDLSKIDAGQFQLDPHPFNPETLIDNLLSLFSQSAFDKGIVLSAEVDPAVGDAYSGDELRLRQVLSNLLSNAIKFTEQGTVCLRIGCGERAEDTDSTQWIRFEVRDTGSGINEDTRAKLFKPFSQGDSSISRRYGGTGLGLAISARLVSFMGGDVIHLESAPGEGSSFSFEIPLHCCTPQEFEQLSRETMRQMPDEMRFIGHVLLAEDNRINQEVARTQLERLGVSVVVVNNGLQAVEAVSQQSFDLVLMDIQMPVMDGFEATRQILNIQPSIPVVALTAAVMADDRKHAAEAGMCDHLGKPFGRDALAEMLAKWLNVAATEPSVAAVAIPTPARSASCDEPILDSDWGVQQLAGNRRLYCTLLDQLRADLQQRYAVLTEVTVNNPAADAETAQICRREAHSLKGSAANLGAERIAAAAAVLEQTWRTGQEPASAQQQLFASVLDATVIAIEQFLSEPEEAVSSAPCQTSQSGEAQLDRATASDLLGQLLARVSRSEFIDDAVILNCSRVVPAIHGACWQAVETALDELDFERAGESLEALMARLEVDPD